jgi:hypothetical protein
VAQLNLPAMPRAQGARVGAALQAELARLLVQPALQQQLRAPGAAERLAAAALDGGALALRRAERPERTGQRLAQQLVDSLLAAADGTGARTQERTR